MNEYFTKNQKYYMDWIDKILYHVNVAYLDTFLEDCKELNIPIIEVNDWSSSLYPGHVWLTEQHHLKKCGKTCAPYFMDEL